MAAIRALGDGIVHVHRKDSYVDKFNIDVNGSNDGNPCTEIPKLAWTFGYGHDVKIWRDIIGALRIVDVISIEHEDALMSTGESLRKGSHVAQGSLHIRISR